MAATEKSAAAKEVLYTLNGLTCRAVVTTAECGPMEFLIN